MKTEYYIGKKKLMRMSKHVVRQMWHNPEKTQDSLPDHWGGVVDYIFSSQEQAERLGTTDQQRRKELEKLT